MSRNKREGLYIGKLMGKHCRTKNNLKGNKYMQSIAFGMYKLFKLPHKYAVFEEMHLRGLPVW